ncbi:DivIVA domain-containing protein [Microtetraspora malaysiensis]|uniref:DivIVA domain-containing protein n=1 Tax=Microtetraspora malaysiensis TaxID=161358 RepID=UPI003D8ED340
MSEDDLPEFAMFVEPAETVGYQPNRDTGLVGDYATGRSHRLMGEKLFDVVLRGYDRRQVDAFWARVDANAITRDEVREAAFNVVIRGYDPHQVHAALADVVKTLEERFEG